MHHRFDHDGQSHAVWLARIGLIYELHLNGSRLGAVSLIEDGPGFGRLIVNGESEPVAYVVDGDTIHMHCVGRAFTLNYVDPLVAFAAGVEEGGQSAARAPMPGVVVAVKVEPGDAVIAGAILVVIESMKLETAIRAPRDGCVERIHVNTGDSFDRDAVLVTLTLENC